MALWICTGCTCRYAVGAPRCPQCGSAEHIEEGQDMPKITVYGGPSIAGASMVGGSWSNEGDPDVWPEPADEEGGEGSSPGSSSSTSPEPRQPNAEPSETTRPSRARSAGNRSKPGRKAARSTAGSTDGSGPETATAE